MFIYKPTLNDLKLCKIRYYNTFRDYKTTVWNVLMKIIIFKRHPISSRLITNVARDENSILNTVLIFKIFLNRSRPTNIHLQSTNISWNRESSTTNFNPYLQCPISLRLFHLDIMNTKGNITRYSNTIACKISY